MIVVTFICAGTKNKKSTGEEGDLSVKFQKWLFNAMLLLKMNTIYCRHGLSNNDQTVDVQSSYILVRK